MSKYLYIRYFDGDNCHVSTQEITEEMAQRLLQAGLIHDKVGWWGTTCNYYYDAENPELVRILCGHEWIS